MPVPSFTDPATAALALPGWRAATRAPGPPSVKRSASAMALARWRCPPMGFHAFAERSPFGRALPHLVEGAVLVVRPVQEQHSSEPLHS
jgi:hypothetical protein